MLFYEIDSTCCMHDCTCYSNLEQCSLLVNYGKFALHDFENYNTIMYFLQDKGNNHAIYSRIKINEAGRSTNYSSDLFLKFYI